MISFKHWTRGIGTVGLLSVAISLFPAQAQAQAYPNKPIKMIIPYAAGQGTDIVGRYVADEISRALKQAVVIDNRPGAGGNMGTQMAARSAPDGDTLMIGTNATHAANGYLFSQPGFDAQTDFEPIAMVGILPLVYVTASSNPVNNIQDLIAAARSKPDALNTAVSTTTCRMAHELFKVRSGSVMMPIDFKGSAQSITAVLGGHVDYMVDTIASLQAQVASGQLKALGVTSASSSRLLPGVKFIAEQGVAGYELVGWTVIFAPKGIPAEAAQTVSATINKTLERADVQAKLLQMGVDPQMKSGTELKSFIASEKEKWGKLISAAGLKPT
jgi:tripartite-type tricarboxylate transporter receptor subunit TctC